ncbi:MAG: tyrosine-type recombinase/integrase [Flavobacteriia bacterium]|nr:tyrosine-type recombinase/integrase [Flavobacteriia bacterium]
MARIDFYLRNTTIYFDFTHKGLRVQKSSSQKVDPKYWDEQKGRVKVSVNYPIAEDINAKLSDLERRVLKAFNDLSEELSRQPSKIELLDKIERSKTKVQGIVEFATGYLDSNPDNFALKTIAGYRTTVKKMDEYHSHIRITDRSLDLIDYAYFSDFVSFCRKSGDSESNINNRRIKNFKSLMKKAVMLGFTKNDIYNDSRIKRKKFDPIHEVIRAEEIETLRGLELKPNDEKYRDFIIFGFHTGARVSDLKKLTKRNVVPDRKIRGAYTLVFRSEKGRTDVSVPLSDEAFGILKRRNFVVYPGVSEPTLNKAIKRICAMIPTMQQEKVFVDSNGAEKVLRRFEKISAHSLRRSFCTRLAEQGMPLNQIRTYSGHRTISALERYIKGVVDLTDENVRERYF